MEVNAARKEILPCAPRSFVREAARTCVRVIRRPTRCALRAAAWAIVAAGCGGDGALFPSDATYVAQLTSANEMPPRASPGSGTATFEVHDGIATYRVAVSNLSAAATLAHLLIGGRDAIGLVIARLSLSAESGTIATGTIDLRGPITFNNTTISGDSLRTLFENGNAYVNVYTSTYPGGELRGQIRRAP